MKKITKEEAKTMNLLPLGYKHPVRALLETLEPGELLQITGQILTGKVKPQT